MPPTEVNWSQTTVRSGDTMAADVIRVLICEDNATMVKGLEATLERHDRLKVVGHACDGPAAVKNALDLRPDVVLMDLGLPGFGGIEALRRIKAAAPEIRVLVLSGSDDQKTVAAALEAGADGYCLKPIFGSDDLKTAIE